MESDKKTTSDRTFVSISDHLKSHNISMQKYYNLIVKMTKVGCLIPLEVTLTLKKKHDKYHPTKTYQKSTHYKPICLDFSPRYRTLDEAARARSGIYALRNESEEKSNMILSSRWIPKICCSLVKSCWIVTISRSKSE